MDGGEDKANLIEPYGGRLVNLLVSEEREELWHRTATLPRLQFTPRSICDLELLATGGFSPLDRFMDQEDYQRVLEEMCLMNDLLYPIPLTFSLNRDSDVHLDSEIPSSDQYNNLLAFMRVDEIYEWDKEHEAQMELAACSIIQFNYKLASPKSRLFDTPPVLTVSKQNSANYRAKKFSIIVFARTPRYGRACNGIQGS